MGVFGNKGEGMNNGFIKLHRKILDNPIIMKDAEHLAIWIYLLLEATHKSVYKLFKGKKIILEAGQLITGRNVISKELNIKSSKVQRVLEDFEKEQQIEQQMSNQNRLVSILKWNEYQNSEQQLNNNRTTTEQQLNTLQEYKEEKEYKESISKDIPKKVFKKPSIEEIQEYCNERNNNVDADRFYDFYESKGWMVGKNKMKDWKAAVRTWEQKEDKLPQWFNENYKKDMQNLDELEKVLEDFK